MRIIKKIGKITAWVVGSLLGLVLLVLLLIQIPAIQNFLKNKAVAYLEKKIGTRVEVERLAISFPKKVVLEGVYFEDQAKDTLLAGERLAVDVSMFALLQSKLEINDVELTGIRANIYRNATDSNFNYQYIVDAFATPEPQQADTSGGFTIDIERVALERVTASFRDVPGGMDFYTSIGEFETRISEFDLDHMRYGIPKVKLENVITRIRQTKPLVEPKSAATREAESNEPIQLALKLGTVSLKKILFNYDNDIDDVHADVDLGAFSVEADTLDLQRLYVKLKKLALADTRAVIKLGPAPPAQEVAEQTAKVAEAQANNPWKVLAASLQLTNVNLKFDNEGEPRQPRGMDYAHLDVQKFLLDAEDLVLTPTVYEGSVLRGEVREANSGFVLNKLKTDFRYTDNGIALNDLLLQTDATILRDSIRLEWPSLDALAADPGSMLMNVSLNKSVIASKDVLTFVPFLATLPPFQSAPNAIYNVDLETRGPLSDLRIPTLNLQGLSNTQVQLSGTVKGLPDGERALFNINIAQLRSSASDLNRLLPAGSLPPDIRVPENFLVTGAFVGSPDDFRTALNIGTTRGSVEAVATMRNFGEGGYTVNATTKGLDLGYLLKQEANVGKVSAKVEAQGRGFEPKTAVAQFKATVYNAYANSYNYQNVAVSGNIARGLAKVNGISRDPNAKLQFTAKANLLAEYPAVETQMQIDSVDLYALKLYSTPFKIHGDIDADFSSLNPDNPIGRLQFTDGVFATDTSRFITDTLLVNMARVADSGYVINVASEVVNANMWGEYGLTHIGPAVINLLNRYYKIPGATAVAANAPAQQFNLRATVIPSPLLFQLVPALKGSAPTTAAIDFNSATDLFQADVVSPRLMFGTYRADSLTVRANAADSALTYAVNTQRVTDVSTTENPMTIYETSIAGQVVDSKIDFALKNLDAGDSVKYLLAGRVASPREEVYQLSLIPGQVRLNYSPWTVAPDNFLEYGPQGILAQNFKLSNGGESLSVNSTEPVPNAPLQVKFADFKIATLTGFVGQDSLALNGLVNGNATLRNLQDSIPSFTSDIKVGDFTFNNDTLGDILVQANNNTPGAIDANVVVEGAGNDIRLSGLYYMAGQKLNMNLNIGNINLAKLPALSAGQVAEAAGGLQGTIAIKGTVPAPNLDGKLHFDSAYVLPAMLGARLYIPNEDIFVSPTGFRFDQFTIRDSAGNKLAVNGNILTKDFLDYKFGLTVKAQDFLLVNATRKPATDQLFYGRLNLSTDLAVKGDLGSPAVTGSVKINEGTDFKALLPSENPEVEAGIGVVRFVDKSNPDQGKIFARNDSIRRSTQVQGVTANVNIKTDSNARFTMVIDERNGDALSLRGTSNLAVGMDKSGKVSLTGAFQLQEGSYLMTLNFLKRQFSIQPGSTINWTGDPTTADVNITAVYVAKTASIDLVQSQLAGSAQAELNRYKQQLPFQVLLQMKGELLKPIITFDIKLAPETASQWQVVSSRLDQIRNNESELNKQVFALLLLNRFITETPLQDYGSGGGGVDAYVRQSASRVLTDQLNKIAGSLVSGVDINIGVNSTDDYSTGTQAQRTDVSVGVSKRLLNDRLRVNVGSNFEVEGPQQANANASQIAGDVSIQYQLTQDGRYMVGAYRRNQNNNITIGQVIETGATFGVSVEYDKFREFFQKSEESRQKREKRRNEARSKAQTEN